MGVVFNHRGVSIGGLVILYIIFQNAGDGSGRDPVKDLFCFLYQEVCFNPLKVHFTRRLCSLHLLCSRIQAIGPFYQPFQTEECLATMCFHGVSNGKYRNLPAPYNVISLVLVAGHLMMAVRL